MNAPTTIPPQIADTATWSTVEFHGETFDISHLRAYETTFERPAEPGKPAVIFKVAVSFSHHVFTSGLPPEDVEYDESLEYRHLNELRLFDRRRWQLSHALRTIIHQLPRRTCHHGKNSNFFTFAAADEHGNAVEYEVFFRVRKTGRGRLWLHIESAYVRDPDRLADRPTGRKVSFLLVLYSVLNGKQVKP